MDGNICACKGIQIKRKDPLSYTRWTSHAIHSSYETPPKYLDVNWLHEEMERAKRDEGMCITRLEWEYG